MFRSRTTGPQFKQLQRQVEASFEIGRIHDLDDDVRPHVQDMHARDLFFGAVGRQAIRAGQVHHAKREVLPDAGSLLGLHGDAGIVGHVLVGAGQVVKDAGLARVRVFRPGPDGSSAWIGFSLQPKSNP